VFEKNTPFFLFFTKKAQNLLPKPCIL